MSAIIARLDPASRIVAAHVIPYYLGQEDPQCFDDLSDAVVPTIEMARKAMCCETDHEGDEIFPQWASLVTCPRTAPHIQWDQIVTELNRLTVALRGWEPLYEPKRWNKDFNLQETHNCFSYAMNVNDPKHSGGGGTHSNGSSGARHLPY